MWKRGGANVEKGGSKCGKGFLQLADRHRLTPPLKTSIVYIVYIDLI